MNSTKMQYDSRCFLVRPGIGQRASLWSYRSYFRFPNAGDSGTADSAHPDPS